MSRLKIALFLAMISITIAEFVTGATPLTKIITDPASFFLFSMPTLLGIYGCGVILIREASVRWQKGWPTILLLGIAYGILEEGVAAHTFFDPVNSTVGNLGSYGRFLGVDFTWAIAISIFHAVFSISLPILITRILWPKMNNVRLLRKKGLAAIFFLYIFTLVVLDAIIPYRPPLIYSVALFFSAGILSIIAKSLPTRLFLPPISQKNTGNAKFFLSGLVVFPLVVFFPRMDLPFPPVIPDMVMIILSLILFWYVSTRTYGRPNRSLAVLLVGLTTPLMFFGALISVEKNPLGLLAIVALILVEIATLKSSGSKRTDNIAVDNSG